MMYQIEEQIWFLWSMFAGGFLGGELLIIPMIVFIKMQEASFILCMAAAFTGTLLRDVLLFFGFRIFGQKLLNRFSSLQASLDIANPILNRRSMNVLYMYRMFIGMVIFLVILFGLSKMKIKDFLWGAFISNVIFILVIGILGFYFTDLMLYFLDFLKEYQFISVFVMFTFVFFIFKIPILFKNFKHIE